MRVRGVEVSSSPLNPFVGFNELLFRVTFNLMVNYYFKVRTSDLLVLYLLLLLPSHGLCVGGWVFAE